LSTIVCQFQFAAIKEVPHGFKGMRVFEHGDGDSFHEFTRHGVLVDGNCY